MYEGLVLGQWPKDAVVILKLASSRDRHSYSIPVFSIEGKGDTQKNNFVCFLLGWLLPQKRGTMVRVGGMVWRHGDAFGGTCLSCALP